MATLTSWRRHALRSSAIIALMTIWEGTARSGHVSTFLLPPLTSVLSRLAQDVFAGDFATSAGLTLFRTAVGFGIAAVFGILLGVLIARVSIFRWFFDPLVSVGLPTPKIAFLPIFVLWFGVFDASKIWMAAFNAIFPVIVATWAGTQAVDKFVLWSASGMGASRTRVSWDVALPAALPSILTGLQIALPIALIVTVVSEMASGSEGLGGAMILSMRMADSLGVFSGLIGTAIVGQALLSAMQLGRQRLLSWHEETQS
ncbi:MAG: hypothetical protein JWM36_2772 [Hyphomicrobiales bacterium]|nr:hypothetical protein [Hyphomicrobiales bacterium]